MEDPACSELVRNEPTRSVLRRDDTQVVGSDAIHPRSAVIREARQGPDPRGKLAGVARQERSIAGRAGNHGAFGMDALHQTRRPLGPSSAGLTCGPGCLIQRRIARQSRGC